MTSGSDPILTIPKSFGPDSIIKGLKPSSSSNTTDSSQDNIVWKDLGQYLETLTEAEPEETNFKNNLNLTKPLSTVISYRICNSCDRPILTSHLPKHIKLCLEMKQQKEKIAAENAILVNDKPNSTTNYKKRVRDQTPLDSDNTPTPKVPKNKKNKKDTPVAAVPSNIVPLSKNKKRTTAKNKGPVDVEKQCGVALPDGGFCARSLTCKTHSMGAKRAVPGRSAPYDVLLSSYQHKNQAKIAGQAAKAQADKDELIHGGSATLDSDEETQQVLSGVSRSFPLPLERKNLIPTKIRSNFLRMREMFAGAILPRITNSNGVGGMNGRTALLDVDKSNEYLLLVRAPQRIMLNKNNIQQNPSSTNNPNISQQLNVNNSSNLPPTAQQQAAILAQQQRNAILAQQARQRASQQQAAQAQSQTQSVQHG